MVFFENVYRTQTTHWYQHCHQNSRALWHFSHQVSDSFFLWGTVLYFCCVNRFFLPSVGRSQTSVLILICPLQSILASISGSSPFCFQTLTVMSCLPQVLQGVDSRDGSEARSGLPVRHPGPVHTWECQHHELRTGGQTITYSNAAYDALT